MGSEKEELVAANKKGDCNMNVKALAAEKLMKLRRILYFRELHGGGNHETPKDLYW